MATEEVFPKILEEEENFARYTQLLETFSPGMSVPFDFPPGINRARLIGDVPTLRRLFEEISIYPQLGKTQAHLPYVFDK